MRWDIFCRVIDNLGDIGVCWRLGAELGDDTHVSVTAPSAEEPPEEPEGSKDLP